jgi:hypothetical protein
MDLMLSANRSLTTTIGNDFLRADRDHTTLYGLAGNATLRGAVSFIGQSPKNLSIEYEVCRRTPLFCNSPDLEF